MKDEKNLKKTVNIDNFISIYDNYILKSECDKAIKLFEDQDKFKNTINRLNFENAPIVKKQDQQFPRFETYRDQIDGQNWFPIYTRADDTLHFKSGDQKIRMIIKYEDYKRFGSDVDITFGEIVDEN